MALVKMCKARAAVHKSVVSNLSSEIQNLGCCQFIKATGVKLEGDVAEGLLTKLKLNEDAHANAKYVCKLLEPYEQNRQGGLFAELPKLTLKQLEEKADNLEFAQLVRWLRKKDKEGTDLRTETAKLNAQAAQLEVLRAIEYPLELFSAGTKEIFGTVFALADAALPQFREDCAEQFGDMAEVKIYNEGNKETGCLAVVLCRRCDADKVRDMAAKLSLTKIEVAREFKRTAEEEIVAVKAKLEKAAAFEEALAKELTEKADEGLLLARYVSDWMSVLHDRLSSVLDGEPTESVFIWDMWLPKERFAEVKALFDKYSYATDFAEIEPEDDELAPTMLKNPEWGTLLQPLTLMYGTPTYGSFDPTIAMTPFFFLFLGMCFGDAGYGLVLSAILGYFLIRYKMPKAMSRTFVMLLVGMICTVIFGFISGSFFGDAFTAFGFMKPLLPFAKKVQLLDPMNDPMTLLGISLVLGFIQVIVGVSIAFYMNWKNGDKFAAIADQGGWIVCLIGLVMLGLTMAGKLPASLLTVSKILAGGGALLLVCTQGRSKGSIFGKAFSGVMSLYDVTGYLSDVLSYSRLLALGLGSAAVGLVVNLLCNLIADGVPYVGWLLAAFVFILGHTFSVAANLLGAFIHPLRLQYVEFFGKFYDANGVDFKPLENKTAFARVTE